MKPLRLIQLSWTDDELYFVTGQSRTVMLFAHFCGYQLSNDVVLFYLTDVLYLLVLVVAFEGTSQQQAFIRRLDATGVQHLEDC
jgi:hypothetical protein